MSHDELDLAHRRLCPDGACIGVIGSDGKCRVCGRRSDAPADADAEVDAEWEADADSESDSDSESESDSASASESDSESAFDPDRRLCPDGACIGLIGADGRCNVCGSVPVSS